mgnify:CR=1 FL=1
MTTNNPSDRPDPQCKLSTFTGTVDQLLAHVDLLDEVTITKDVEAGADVILSDGEAVLEIMKEVGCDRDEATKILQEIKLLEVDEAIQNLVNDGLVEIKSFDKDGNPDMFGLTQLGKNYAEKLKKDGLTS